MTGAQEKIIPSMTGKSKYRYRTRKFGRGKLEERWGANVEGFLQRLLQGLLLRLSHEDVQQRRDWYDHGVARGKSEGKGKFY